MRRPGQKRRWPRVTDRLAPASSSGPTELDPSAPHPEVWRPLIERVSGLRLRHPEVALASAGLVGPGFAPTAEAVVAVPEPAAGVDRFPLTRRWWFRIRSGTKCLVRSCTGPPDTFAYQQAGRFRCWASCPVPYRSVRLGEVTFTRPRPQGQAILRDPQGCPRTFLLLPSFPALVHRPCTGRAQATDRSPVRHNVGRAVRPPISEELS